MAAARDLNKKKRKKPESNPDDVLEIDTSKFYGKALEQYGTQYANAATQPADMDTTIPNQTEQIFQHAKTLFEARLQQLTANPHRGPVTTQSLFTNG